MKFRVYDFTGKKMHYFSGIFNLEPVTILQDWIKHTLSTEMIGMEVKDEKSEPIDVYDGDIIQMGNQKTLHLIKFLYGKIGFWVLDEDSDREFDHLSNWDNSYYKIKVVGNCYENEYLLDKLTIK